MTEPERDEPRDTPVEVPPDVPDPQRHVPGVSTRTARIEDGTPVVDPDPPVDPSLGASTEEV